MYDRLRGICYLHKQAFFLSGELENRMFLRIGLKGSRGAEEGPPHVKRLKVNRLHDDLPRTIFY